MAQPLEEKKSVKQKGQQGGMKKPYTSPKLLEYGSIAKLTKGSTGAKGDGGPTKKP